MSEPVTNSPGTGQSRQAALIGTAAALGAVLIWSGWIVATRHAAQTLEISVVALLRYGIPALALTSLWLNLGLLPSGVSRKLLATLVIGAGAPFFLTAALGMRFAPAAEVAPLLPGAMPLFTALLVGLFYREKSSWWRTAGFVLIGAGVMAVVVPEIFANKSSEIGGHLLVLLSALLWAVYTVALRRSGFTPFQATAFISVWSTIALLPFGTMPLINTLTDGRAGEVAIQALVQGVLSGIVATILFAIAILELGASRAAAFAALIPVLVAALAYPLLGEIPTSLTLVGIFATSLGVALASGAFER
jgi:drug/metabolite transporter (DMT)-like permease